MHLIRGRGLRALLAVSVWLGTAVSVRAASPGFTEDFSSGVGSFFSGATIAHVSGGGVGGASDGYATVTRTKPENLGVATAGAAFTGDLIADGVTGISFWLQQFSGSQGFEVHVGVGNSFGNFWLSTIPLFPFMDAWTPFTVDFTDSSEWVQIRGSGTFEQALTATDRIVFRHDLAPFEWFPDAADGQLGIDRVTVLPEPGAAALLAVGVLVVGLRRKRLWPRKHENTKQARRERIH